MAKSSRPDRKTNDRRKREPKEFEETTLSVDRVTRVVAGGRRLRFRAVVVVGDKKGKVGMGTGKANDVQAAVQKATAVAKKSMIRIPLKNGTIPHEVDIKYKAARIRLLPASEGTGVIAGSSVRVVLEHAGVKNVLSKRYGTTNKLVNAQCVMLALMSLHGMEELAPEEHMTEAEARAKREKDAKFEDATKTEQGKQAAMDEEALDEVEIKEISHSDVEGGELKGEAVS